MKAVLGANVLVSALLKVESTPAMIVRMWRQGLFQIVTSSSLLSEFGAVLARPRIRRRLESSPAEVSEFVARLTRNAINVAGIRRIDVVRTDVTDNRVLEAAAEGEADYVVTGDTDLLQLVQFEGIQITTPA